MADDKKPLREGRGERPTSPRPDPREIQKNYGERGQKPDTPRPPQPPAKSEK